MISKGIKRFAIIIVILAVVVGAVVFLGDGTSAPLDSQTTSSGLTTSSGVPVVPGGGAEDPTETIDDFAVLLSTVESITIDTTIFSNSAYLALRNNPIQLGTDIVGRNNPFAPLGVDVNVGINSAAITLVTLQPGKVTSTSAEFGGQLTVGDTQPVSIVFEYGPTDTFGSATPPVVTTYTGSVLTTVTGLLPNTTYYVRALGSKNGSSPVTANTMNFTTTNTVKR